MAESRRPVIWSHDARTDLSEIWDYYVKVAGRHTADRMVRGIGEACALLDLHPFAGRARQEVRLAAWCVGALGSGARSMRVNLTDIPGERGGAPSYWNT